MIHKRHCLRPVWHQDICKNFKESVKIYVQSCKIIFKCTSNRLRVSKPKLWKTWNRNVGLKYPKTALDTLNEASLDMLRGYLAVSFCVKYSVAANLKQQPFYSQRCRWLDSKPMISDSLALRAGKTIKIVAGVWTCTPLIIRAGISVRCSFLSSWPFSRPIKLDYSYKLHN